MNFPSRLVRVLEHFDVYSKFLAALQCSRIIQMQYYIANITVGYTGGGLKSFMTEGEEGSVGLYFYINDA